MTTNKWFLGQILTAAASAVFGFGVLFSVIRDLKSEQTPKTPPTT